MAINEVPVQVYTDATGVIDTTAAAEIVVLVASLNALIPDTGHANAQATPPQGVAPAYDNWPPALADEMRAELEAMAAAIAAGPTS